MDNLVSVCNKYETTYSFQSSRLTKFVTQFLTGHNTDGKYFVTSTKMGFHCEMAPKRIVFFIERTKDGKIKPVDVDEIRDFSCGTNHTVSIVLNFCVCFNFTTQTLLKLYVSLLLYF